MSFWAAWGKMMVTHWRGGFRRVLSRWTWELPQTLLGIAAGSAFLAIRYIDAVECADDVVVIRGWGMNPGWGGICYGTVILGDERIGACVNNRLYMHEFGHALQSRASGPIYLFKYGIPSIMSVRGRGIHRYHPVERDANCRAEAYFSRQPGFQDWPLDFCPLPENGRLLPLSWWEYLPGPFPMLHLWGAYRDKDGCP